MLKVYSILLNMAQRHNCKLFVIKAELINNENFQTISSEVKFFLGDITTEINNNVYRYDEMSSKDLANILISERFPNIEENQYIRCWDISEHPELMDAELNCVEYNYLKVE